MKNFLTPLQTLTMPSKLPPTPLSITPDSNYRNGISDKVTWLKTANATNVWTAWARYYSQRSHHTRKLDISAILPLTDATVHTLDTQYHCMEIVEKTTQLFNPGQICVDENDQPVYKSSKELQWRFPDRFGPEKYFRLFGSLHLEKSILLLCGSIIEESGLDKIMASCGLSIIGTDSLVSVNHIKRAMYCIEVAACVMFSLLISAHEKSGGKGSVLQWLKNKSEESEMCHYWYIIIDQMLNLLIFVRSIREANFSLYVSSLKQVVKWCYACDYYHYARWVAVHLYDLVNLPTTSYIILPLHMFFRWLFCFSKVKQKISLMGIDQVHEQNTAVIKGTGRATSVLNKDDKSGLARWELCLHELSLIIKEYESTPEVELDFEALKHHKDSEEFYNQFSVHVSKLKTSILTNPFKLNKLTVLNNEKATFNDIVYDDISKMSKLGEEQFKAFWIDRLVTCKVPVRDPILLNLLNLPGNPNKAKEKDPVLTAAIMEKLKKAGEARSN